MSEEDLAKSVCMVCRDGLRSQYSEKQVSMHEIYLHARKYTSKVDGWSFEAPLPPWANG